MDTSSSRVARSPARPNPVGLHRVTVVAIEGSQIRVQPLEAINGTPLVDIKPVITATNGECGCGAYAESIRGTRIWRATAGR